MHEHSIPARVCLSHAKEVLPFDSIVTLSPSDPPYSWPVLGELSKDDPLPGQKELEQYLASFTASTDEMLLHANGPILRNHTGVCLDLKVILVSLQSSEIDDPKMMFDSINHVRNSEQGIFPLAKWTWPSFFGRWEVDWLSRGYFQPAYFVGDLPVKSIRQGNYSVEHFGGSISNGAWKYWVNQWYPAHHKDVGNPLGTYFTVSKYFFEKLKKYMDGHFYLIGEMTCFDRRGLRYKAEAIKTYAILPL
ncbi:MAG: hypothetical protein RBQ88_10340 [Desulfobulbus oligotrophicus]|jgi:hypothetical protein|nr:hypothetical protein [Desulfobulbus oligotrophicus]